MNNAAPKIGEVREFAETRLRWKVYGPNDEIPLGPGDVDGLLETVNVTREWDGERWMRTNG